MENEGPRKITDPKIKRDILNAFRDSLKELESSKRDIRILIYSLYRNYPSSSKQGSAWIQMVLPEEDIQSYIKAGIFVKSKDGNMIGLGPTGLSLISMWNTEKLSKWVMFLTIITTLISLFNIYLIYIP